MMVTNADDWAHGEIRRHFNLERHQKQEEPHLQLTNMLDLILIVHFITFMAW